jgi:2-amino-4-hydroxy-6-hydroxymethyldihydropteridine diphosphokinase
MLKSTERDAWIGLGSNVGDPVTHLKKALIELGGLKGTRVLRHSSIVASTAVGPTQPDYVNAVAQIATKLSPMELLGAMKGLERLHAREKTIRWGPRTLDLDLLFYEDRVVEHPLLTIPHPQMHMRRFVLAPMCELDPQKRHPTLDRTVEELLQALT